MPRLPTTCFVTKLRPSQGWSSVSCRSQVRDELDRMLRRMERLRLVHSSATAASAANAATAAAARPGAAPAAGAPRRRRARPLSGERGQGGATTVTSVDDWLPGMEPDEVKLSHTSVSSAQMAALVMLLTLPEHEERRGQIKCLSLQVCISVRGGAHVSASAYSESTTWLVLWNDCVADNEHVRGLGYGVINLLLRVRRLPV